MPVQTLLPMATRTNTTITSPAVDPPPSVNGVYLEVVAAANNLDTPDEVVELVVEREVGGTGGTWEPMASATFVGGEPLGRSGKRYLEVSIARDLNERIRGRCVVTGTVRFRLDGEIRRVGGNG